MDIGGERNRAMGGEVVEVFISRAFTYTSKITEQVYADFNKMYTLIILLT